MKADHIEKRARKVPKPPPKSFPSDLCIAPPKNSSLGRPLPPPPPVPRKTSGPPPVLQTLQSRCGGSGRPSHSTLPPVGAGTKVFRLPELVDFYHSLMKREARGETSSATSLTASDARSNYMIGEIESKSAFLLAVRADVETQGDFVQSLAAEVRAATFTNIEDVVSFVKWLDEELAFLVDERAVLKHFDWPEGKTDALREAAFEYQYLINLEKKISSYVIDHKLPCQQALHKMQSLHEKVEESIHALLRNRESDISRYKELGIPVDWLVDSGAVLKIKLSSVELARKFMKRVASELDSLSGPKKERNRQFLILQGVRFAFRIHQFAGGFDTHSMMAFEELKGRIQAN